MGNKRNRRQERVESQSPDGEENLSETSIKQENTTLTNVSNNADNVFDRNLGSELTDPSQNNKMIEIISQRLTEQNNTKISQIEEHLNSNFEEILEKIRANKNCDKEKDKENCNLGPSKLRNERLKKKHASNIKSNRDRKQDNRFPSSDMDELRLPSTRFGVANETLDDTVIINEKRKQTGSRLSHGDRTYQEHLETKFH